MADEEKTTDNTNQEAAADTAVKEEAAENPDNIKGSDEDSENEQKADTAKEEADKDNIQPDEDVDLDNPDEVSKALDKRGIDYNALSEEYFTNGKLSEKSMEALVSAGIPSELVDNYIKGYEARAELERNELAESVGGRETLKEIINWASANLAKEEIIALNEIRNKFELKAVLRGLKTSMEEKEGKAPVYQKGTGDKPAINGYRSQAEMFEAIRDPKYNKDEAYRADVQKKIAASREAGIDLGIY